MRLPRLPVAAVTLLASTFALAVAPRPVAAAEDYVVKGSRPTKVGDTYRIDVTYTYDRAITVRVGGGDGEVDRTKRSVTLVGDVTVLEVADDGDEKKVRVKVVALKSARGDREARAVVPEGTTLIAWHDGKSQVITREAGDALDAESAALASCVIRVDDPTTPDDDEAHNPKGRKKVGDSWAMDKRKLAGPVGNKETPTDDRTLEGRVTLAEVKRVDDVDSMVLRADVGATMTKGAALPDFPPGILVDGGDYTMSIAMVTPLDVSKHATGVSWTVESNVDLSGPAPRGGGKLNVSIKTITRLDAKAKYK